MDTFKQPDNNFLIRHRSVTDIRKDSYKSRNESDDVLLSLIKRNSTSKYQFKNAKYLFACYLLNKNNNLKVFFKAINFSKKHF